MATTRTRTFLFAGGGSGGHIAPALAIAERLIDEADNARAHFACSTRPVDAAMLSSAGVTYTPLDAAPLHKSPLGIARFLIGSWRANMQARRLIRARNVDHVVLLGGFVAAPAAAAADAMRVPVTLINLDLPPGKANRVCARYVNDIISAIPAPPTERSADALNDLPEKFLATVVSTPVRRQAVADADAAECRRRLGLDPDRRTLLITGASQGATSINELMTSIARTRADWLGDWQVLHLAGRGADQPVKTAYGTANVHAAVFPFLDRMGDAWGAADLAISRAGANSVAEVAANAVPTVFLPYPWHADRHQWRNAQPLADAGGAIICDDHVDLAANLETIGPVLRGLLSDDARRHSMREALRASRPADGATAIARHLLNSIDSP